MSNYNWFMSDAYIKSKYDAMRLELPPSKKWFYQATAFINNGKIMLVCITDKEEHLTRTLEYWYGPMKVRNVVVTGVWK